MRFLLHTLLIFFLVNGFYLYPPINSAFIIPIILFLKPSAYANTIRLLLCRETITLYTILLLMFTLSLLIILLHGSTDLSYSKNFISQFILLTMTIICCGIIYTDISNIEPSFIEYAEKIIVLAFVIQSVIQIAAFISPQVASIVHITYTDASAMRLYEKTKGIRGLALTGSPGWGLAIGYGMAFLFYTKQYIVQREISLRSILIGLLLVLGTFFSGRSGFVGAILSIPYFLFSNNEIKNKIKDISFGIIGFSIVVILFCLIFNNFIGLLAEKAFPWIFEFYYSYEQKGQLETRSTNILFNMWQTKPDENSFLIGDGLFTDPVTGSFYKSIDIGLLRNLFFGGIFWVILLFIYHGYINSLHLITKTKVTFNYKTFLVFLFLLCSILELKAMTIGFNRYCFSILSFYHIFSVLELRRDNFFK